MSEVFGDDNSGVYVAFLRGALHRGECSARYMERIRAEQAAIRAEREFALGRVEQGELGL